MFKLCVTYYNMLFITNYCKHNPYYVFLMLNVSFIILSLYCVPPQVKMEKWT